LLIFGRRCTAAQTKAAFAHLHDEGYPMSKLSTLGAAAALAACLQAGSVHAHFHLLKPASWLKEDNLGGPQKGKPCGPGGYDDVQPVPMSMDVTTVHAGDTIQVELQETINHPGYFRIALAADRAAFQDPPFTNATACSLDLDAVMTGPHDNVLMDGIAKSSASGSNRHIMQDVKLPDQPCDKCTLQVIQVMKDHGPPNCIYYHCADLKILPADGAAAGSGGSNAGTGVAGSGTGGMSAGTGGAPAGGRGGASVSVTGGAGASTGTAAVSGTAGSSQVGGGASGSAGPSSAGSTSSAPGTAGSSTAQVPAAGSAAPSASPAKAKSGCSVARIGGGSDYSPSGLLSVCIALLSLGRMRRHLRRRRSYL
jgi:hypothetical protein